MVPTWYQPEPRVGFDDQQTCVCECKCYQISIYHHTSSKTLLMPSPQCILTIPGYKTKSNSGGNSRYTQHRPDLTKYPRFVTVESSLSISSLLQWQCNGWFRELRVESTAHLSMEDEVEEKGSPWCCSVLCDLSDYVCRENIPVLGDPLRPHCGSSVDGGC